MRVCFKHLNPKLLTLNLLKTANLRKRLSTIDSQSSTMKHLIFTGSGLSALSLVMRLIDNGVADTHLITLIDKERKEANDRTWCFWEKEDGFFDKVVYRRWKHLEFYSNFFQSPLSIDPYEYKMIRAVDFYKHCFDRIQKHPNIFILNGEVLYGEARDGQVQVQLSDGRELVFDNAVGFNSIPSEQKPQPGDVRLLQHFKGWIIETPTPFFDTNKATLMDFRVSQKEGTSFVYVLPLGASRALVEYTLFTENILPDAEYEGALRDYCEQFLQLKQYVVADEEFGVIPMNNLRYPAEVNGMIQIGTAGGQTKASSGYTFQFIQKQSAAMAALLEGGEDQPLVKADAWRFRFYDHTLLHILKHRQYPGDKIFATLFRKNPSKRVLRFLDNETTLSEEIKLLWSLPTWPFFKAAIQKRKTY